MSQFAYTAFPPRIILVPDSDGGGEEYLMAFLLPDGMGHQDGAGVLAGIMEQVTAAEDWTWEEAIPLLGAAGLVQLEPYITKAY